MTRYRARAPPASRPRARAGGTGDRSGLRHERGPGDARAIAPTMPAATYFFCGARCRERFVAEPERFAGDRPVRRAGGCGRGAVDLPDAPGDRARGAGSCPICGMALEPMTPAAGDESSPELADMTRRFWVGVALSLPLLVMAMAEHVVPGWHQALASRTAIWVQLALATPVVLWCGAPFFRRGWQSLVNRHLNMFTLIALGTGVAYLYSLVATALPASSRPRSAAPRAASRSISRRLRSSSRWCCSGRCSNCAPAPGHMMRSARCSTLRRNAPVSSPRTAPSAMSISPR